MVGFGVAVLAEASVVGFGVAVLAASAIPVFWCLESGRPGVRLPLAPRGFFWDLHTSDLNIGTQVAIFAGAQGYSVRAGTGWPGVGILWLGKIESLICNFCTVSMWQQVKLSEQIRPWDTLACCCYVKQLTNQPTHNPTRGYLRSVPRHLVHHCRCATRSCRPCHFLFACWCFPQKIQGHGSSWQWIWPTDMLIMRMCDNKHVWWTRDVLVLSCIYVYDAIS